MTEPRRAQRSRSIPVAVLGATGAVGQTFVRLLDDHPSFDLVAVAASERSVGKRYGDAVHWLEGDLAPRIAAMPVLPCSPQMVEASLVFSALDSTVAGTIEQSFAQAGRFVLSNARNHRMDDDVPLVIPEVNPEHVGLLALQRERRGWPGAIVTNANCASIVITLALAPLHQAFGITRLFVTTLQAASGAGYPGVPSLDLLGNVIPFIGGEEETKIETETLKMLGRYTVDGVVPAKFPISAQVNRVPVEHGHTACMAVEFERRVAPQQASDALRAWKSAIATLQLPSAPAQPIIVTEEPARPQPRRDVHAGGGMTVTVGRIRGDPILDVRLVASGHNTIRGAAGASILNGEMLVARGLIEP
jgi:aspartate-semialdehyde dehydrogenase